MPFESPFAAEDVSGVPQDRRVAAQRPMTQAPPMMGEYVNTVWQDLMLRLTGGDTGRSNFGRHLRVREMERHRDRGGDVPPGAPAELPVEPPIMDRRPRPPYTRKG